MNFEKNFEHRVVEVVEAAGYTINSGASLIKFSFWHRFVPWIRTETLVPDFIIESESIKIGLHANPRVQAKVQIMEAIEISELFNINMIICLPSSQLVFIPDTIFTIAKNNDIKISSLTSLNKDIRSIAYSE